MIPHQTNTIHGWQTMSLTNRERNGIRSIGLSITRNNVHISRTSQIMSWSKGCTHCHPVFLGNLLCILSTKIQTVTVYLRIISSGQSLIICIAVAIGDIFGIITPKIRNIGTNRESLDRLPTCTDINLMQATLTVVGVCIIDILIRCIYPACRRIVISNISERNHTETHSEMTEKAETSYYILEIGIIGILLHSVLLKVSNLTRDTCIKDEGHGIKRSIGSRVQIIHLIMLMKTKPHTIHTTIEAGSLVRQHA